MEIPIISFRLGWWFFLVNLVICISSFKLESVSCSTPIFGNETDKLALLAFKNHLIDVPNGILSSWNDSVHFCEWEGVTCSRRHQRVTVLRLEGQSLGGSLPPNLIGNLTFLRQLVLSNNNLQGSIPSDIGLLRRLQHLNLSRNSLHGQIPVELTNCSNLITLSLSGNNLTGQIPFHVGRMSKLQALGLMEDSLTGVIPSTLGNLSSLQKFSVAYNHLEGGIPHDLGRLKSLKILYLGSNNFSGTVPPSLYNLSSLTDFALAQNILSGNFLTNMRTSFPKLRKLGIGENRFTGIIPETLSNISGLELLDLAHNYLTGQVPDSLGELKDLQWLNLEYNNLGRGMSGNLNFLNSLTNISSLRILVFGGNNFGGVLPNSIVNLSTQMQVLYFEGNRISGSIPEEIGNLINLTTFIASENDLTGVIPTSLGKLQSLRKISLTRNRVSGLLPSSLGNLSLLYYLDMSDNNLEGNIPTFLRNCNNLQILNLSDNKLSGSVPENVIGHFNQLRALYLQQNSFTGSIPADVGRLKNLNELIVSDNNLSGEIPRELGSCSVLEYLDMARNSFQGNIPLSFSSLRGIQFLDLSCNNLSGMIPKELQNLSGLLSLNLSFNHLEGEVPSGGVFRNMSAFSVMGNKKLCGGISQLQLPPCSDVSLSGKNGKGKHLSIKIIIAISITGVSCLAFIVASVLLYKRKKTLMRFASTSLGYGYLRVSYQELLKATAGFSSSNLVGMGSFGSVYKGILGQDERPVAVKVLNLQQRGAGKSFMAECKVLRKIQHRNLLSIITSCSSIDHKGNEFKALVFEYMTNGNLDNFLHHECRSLSLRERLDIAMDVANALDYLHHQCETPIVHGDLKPSNVLVDEDMVAHVGDFGLAKFLPDAKEILSSGDQTSSALMMGSIGYVAPGALPLNLAYWN